MEPVFIVRHQHATIGGDGLSHLAGVAAGGGALAALLLRLPAAADGDSYVVTRYDLDDSGVATDGTVING